MANGAAGCGFEYRNENGLCGFLDAKNLENKIDSNLPTENTTFYCLKYREQLDKQRKTNHPFRCTKCTKSV